MHSVYIVIDTRNSYGIYTVRPTGFGGASAENPFRHVFNFKLFSFNLTFRWMNSRANESLNVRFVWNQDVDETVRREREKSELTRQFSFQTKNTRENSLVGHLLGVGRTFFFFFLSFPNENMIIEIRFRAESMGQKRSFGGATGTTGRPGNSRYVVATIRIIRRSRKAGRIVTNTRNRGKGRSRKKNRRTALNGLTRSGR